MILMSTAISLKAQFREVKTYDQLATYVDSMEISFPKIANITATVMNLNLAHIDSLESTVFSKLKAREMDTSFQIFANQQMAVMSYQLLGDLDLALKYQMREVELIRTTADSSYLMMAYGRLMFIQNDLGMDEKAYASSLRVVRLLETEPAGVNKIYALRGLCVFYNTVTDYERALPFCEAGISLNEELGQSYYLGDFYLSLVTILNNQGVTNAESIPVRRKALHYARLNRDSLALHTTLNSLARSFAATNQPDSAIKYFELSLNAYEGHPYLFGRIQQLSDYGQFLIEQGDTKGAKELSDTLEILVRGKEITSTVLKSYYFFQASYYSSQADVQMSSYWLARRDSLLIKTYDEAKAVAQEEMQAKFESERKEAENRLLKLESQSRLAGIIGLTVLSVLLVVLIVLIVQRRLRDKEFFTQQQHVASLELERANQRRILAENRSQALKADLDSRLKQVMSQQVVNGELMELILDLRDQSDSSLVRKATAQMKSKLNENMISNVFEEILAKMKELHPELLEYLEEVIGSKKENEVVSTAMYFLGYETKDIAKVLQRTEKAVRSMRYRVRKKMGLADGDDLIEFLEAQNQRLSQRG